MNLYFKSKDEINTFFNQKNKKSENNSAVAVPHLKKKKILIGILQGEEKLPQMEA